MESCFASWSTAFLLSVKHSSLTWFLSDHQRAVPKDPSVASESDNEAPAALTTDDESDGETAALAKYHPRSILFSGLPQV